jgi:enoyl-CoA hydratase/long-chain 3-hydroxyacyl-CoA dehydrogenase
LHYNLTAPSSFFSCVEDEATKFCELAQTSVSEALIGLFDASTAAKKSRFGEPDRKVQSIAVLGAGLMGAGIAQVRIHPCDDMVY